MKNFWKTIAEHTPEEWNEVKKEHAKQQEFLKNYDQQKEAANNSMQ